MRLILVLLLTATPLLAQSGKLQLNFEHLVARAEETVDVTLEGDMLRLASQFLSNRDETQRKVKQAIAGLTAIYVKSFKFDDRDAYSPAELDRVRSQLAKPWERIVRVREREGDNVEIYVRPGEKTARGIVVIAAEPREFTVIQLVGEIDLAQLADLEGEFGIPRMDIPEGKE